MKTACIRVDTPLPSSDLITNFLQDMELRGHSKNTLRSYGSSIRLFAHWLNRDLVTAGKEDFKKYVGMLRKEGLAYRTMKSRFQALSAFYNYLEEEEMIEKNPVPAFIKRYLRSYKNYQPTEERQLISVDDAARLVKSIMSTRDKAVVLLLLKTGIRIGELARAELHDIDIERLTLTLKPTPKRSNLTVFFDYETAECLEAWLLIRGPDPGPLFLGRSGGLGRSGIEDIVKRHAARAGLHKPDSRKLKDRFTAHCCRHWFTTHLIRAGMRREYIEELRGDAMGQSIGAYIHIDKKELRESYLAHVPQLGI